MPEPTPTDRSSENSPSPSPNTPQSSPKTPEATFKITIRSTVAGQSDKSLLVLTTATVLQLKLEVEKVTGVPSYSQLLLVAGNELKEDEKPITAYGIGDNAIISLSVHMNTGVMKSSSVPSAVMETIFFQPIVLPDNEAELKKTIRGMGSLHNRRKKKKRVPDVLGDDKWTAEKQKEVSKARSKMRELLKKKKVDEGLVGSDTNVTGARGVSSNESGTTMGTTSSIDQLIADPDGPVTDKELAVFCLPPETKEEWHRLQSQWTLPPQNAIELEGMRQKAQVDMKNKCAECHRKLKAIEQTMVCKCDLSFCAKHRSPDAHMCKIDYKHEGRRKIQKENRRVAEKETRKARSDEDEPTKKDTKESP